MGNPTWIFLSICGIWCLLPPLLGFLLFRFLMKRNGLTVEHSKDRKDGQVVDTWTITQDEFNPIEKDEAND